MRPSETLTIEEAELLLKVSIEQARKNLQALLAPHVSELCEIDVYRRPAPVILPDGRMAQYIGPTMADLAGKSSYSAPAWLRSLAVSDPVLIDALRRHRRHYGPQEPVDAHE